MSDQPNLPEGFRELGCDGHRVRLDFDWGALITTLICPESGCDKGACQFCGANLSDPSSKRCKDCEENPGECWLKSWFENLEADELLHGSVEFPVAASWDGDYPDIRVLAGLPAIEAAAEVRGVEKLEQRLVEGDFPERLTAAIRDAAVEEERERIKSDDAITVMLDLLGERGWHATATREAAEDMASIVAEARQALRDAIDATAALDSDSEGES